MRTMTILVIESADASASSRSFTAELHDNGDVRIDDLDNDLLLDAGTPGARVLSALIASRRSALDMDQLIPEDFGGSSADLDIIPGSPDDPAPSSSSSSASSPVTTTTTITTIITEEQQRSVSAARPGRLASAQP